jgi:hypothetical protein
MERQNDVQSYFDQPHWEKTYFRILQVFGGHWKCFLTISALTIGLRFLVNFIFDWANGPNYGADYSGEELPSSDWATNLMMYGNTLVSQIATCLHDGATIYAVTEIYLGLQPGPIVSIGMAARRLLVLYGSYLLVLTTLIIFMIIVMLVIFAIASTSVSDPGTLDGFSYIVLILLMIAALIIFCIISFNLFQPIIVEKSGVIGSIQRCFRLSQGHLLEIFVTLGIFSVLGFAVTSTIQILTTSDNKGAKIVGMILLYASSVLLASILSM